MEGRGRRRPLTRTFVGPRADYYLARWARIGEGTSRALGFNWAAFFLGFFWLLYRRMYCWFWIGLAALIASFLIEELVLGAVGLEEGPFLGLLITIAIATAFRTFGTYWYYLHALRVAARVTPAMEPDLGAIALAGGTSWWAPTLGVAALLGLLVLGVWAETQAH